ncbi:MAG: Eco57I restriction-modification methylase domain-containing protein [Candidatus Heimdallarchaeota archaeon]
MNSAQKRKSLGQYSTPDLITSYMVTRTLDLWYKTENNTRSLTTVRILDPACGTGSFLAQALKHLLTIYQKEFPEEEDPRFLKRKIIANNLYGIDIDPLVINKTQMEVAEGYKGNVKLFDALMPPPGFRMKAYSPPKTKHLRNEYRNLFITKSDDKRLEKLIKEISQLETTTSNQVMAEIASVFGKIPDMSPPMRWEAVFPETNGKFSIILGNPPWGGILPYPRQFLELYEVGLKQVDTWSLFLERSILALEEGGMLGFVLPNTLLLNENYFEVRQLILEKCLIHEIVNLGERIFPNVTQPSMMIILQRHPIKTLERPIETQIVNQIPNNMRKRLQNEEASLFDLPYLTCPQEYFHGGKYLHFDIFSVGHEKFIKSMESDSRSKKISTKPLGDLVINGRGVEINHEGKIVLCKSCGMWNSPITSRSGPGIKKCAHCNDNITEKNPKDHIVYDTPQENTAPFLTGRDIHRYLIRPPKYIDLTRPGIQYKQPGLFEGEKLLLRKTGNKINLALDTRNHWVNQVVYIFKLREGAPISLEFLLGVLNSKLMQKYYNYKYGDPYRREFPHFTQGKFLQLPIKLPHSTEEYTMARRIGKLAKSLQELSQSVESNNFQSQLSIEVRSLFSSRDADLEELVLSYYNMENES